MAAIAGATAPNEYPVAGGITIVSVAYATTPVMKMVPVSPVSAFVTKDTVIFMLIASATKPANVRLSGRAVCSLIGRVSMIVTGFDIQRGTLTVISRVWAFIAVNNPLV